MANADTASSTNTRETSHKDSKSHTNTHASPGTDWIGVVLGWLSALGAGAILAGIVSAIVGVILEAANNAGAVATESGTTGLIGLLITLLLAFLIGGYCAARMAGHSGVKHGVLVPALALAIAIVAAIIGALVGAGFIDNLAGANLPKLPKSLPEQGLGIVLSVSSLLALIMPFIGGVLGGWLGARGGRRRA